MVPPEKVVLRSGNVCPVRVGGIVIVYKGAGLGLEVRVGVVVEPRFADEPVVEESCRANGPQAVRVILLKLPFVSVFFRVELDTRDRERGVFHRRDELEPGCVQVRRKNPPSGVQESGFGQVPLCEAESERTETSSNWRKLLFISRKSIVLDCLIEEKPAHPCALLLL